MSYTGMPKFYSRNVNSVFDHDVSEQTVTFTSEEKVINVAAIF